MLHVMSARCVARDWHTIAPEPLSVRVGDSSRRSEETVKNLELRLLMQLLLLLLLFLYLLLSITSWNRWTCATFISHMLLSSVVCFVNVFCLLIICWFVFCLLTACIICLLLLSLLLAMVVGWLGWGLACFCWLCCCYYYCLFFFGGGGGKGVLVV